MGNKYLNEVSISDLSKDFYTFAEAAKILGCNTCKLYRYKHLAKDGVIFLLDKAAVVYIANRENARIRNSEFSKATRLYPSMRRVGNYVKHYREKEVLYELGISQEELRRLVDQGILSVTKFSKKGEKRVGYNIKEVMRYKASIDKRS